MVRLDTIIGLPTPVAVIPPGFDVTVQPVIRPPPFDGSLKLTVAREWPPVAATISGASGTVAGVVLPEGAGAIPVSVAFAVAAVAGVLATLSVGFDPVIGLAPAWAVAAPGLDGRVLEAAG